MKTYIVYYHKFPNGKMYFGQTCQDINKRWRNNGKGYIKQKFLYRAIQKYGWDNIEHRIISIGLDKDEADFQEMFYISAYRTNEKEFGYNLDSGGTNGRIITDSYRQKLSESHKGKRCSPNTEFKKGIEPWNKGKNSVYSNETKEKMRLAKLGKKFDKLKYLNENGEIVYMAEKYAKIHHPDWILLN